MRPFVAEPLVAPDDLNRTARLFDARGWQLMTHAAGDRAVRMALDAYAHTVRSNPPPARGRRHRLEHVELADPADLSRLRALNAIASVQPVAGGAEVTPLEAWTASLGPERAGRIWALKSIASAGGRLALGSDWPSAPLNPMHEIHAAVTRMAADADEGSQPNERIGLKAALTAYTAAAAYASFDEHRKGSLTRGMLADMVVLTTDIFSTPPSSLISTGVAATIFDGKIVYRKNPRSLTH
jgi:predicted amidohydrolase YtcJ